MSTGSDLGHDDMSTNISVRLIAASVILIGPTTHALAADFVYSCVDGTAVRAKFSGPGPDGSVRLMFAGQGKALTLPQALSADGGRYTDGSTEFWIKGTTAQLTRAGAGVACKTVGSRK